MAVASESDDLRFTLHEILQKTDHPAHAGLVSTLENLSSEIIEEALTDPHICQLLKMAEANKDSERVRFEVLCKAIDDEIYERRRTQLLQRSGRIHPFDHPALAGVERDGEALVNRSLFNVQNGYMERGGFVFSPAPPLRSLNSQYWSSKVLFGLPSEIDVRIRLDPFLVIPAGSYSPPFYKMLVFGRSLDWKRIAQLKDEEAARWMPDELTFDSEFTDVIWQHRSDGVHFECEEIPKRATERPARYFHAIYSAGTGVFVHSDAAIRYYTQEELHLRRQAHLRTLGKVGVRIKLFRTDGPIDVTTWSALIAGSFVWNNDIQRYFGGERAFAVEHAPLRSDFS